MTAKYAGEEELTTETFLLMCRESRLSFEDMESMNLSDVFDYVYTWIEFHDPDSKNVRKATQEDIDRMF